MTWDDLLALEPALGLLERELRALRRQARGRRTFCAHAVWYRPGGPKSRLTGLVGWSARHPRLRTSGAYDVAYQHLYGLLPACRGCACL